MAENKKEVSLLVSQVYSRNHQCLDLLWRFIWHFQSSRKRGAERLHKIILRMPQSLKSVQSEVSRADWT